MKQIFFAIGIMSCAIGSAQEYGIQWVLSNDSTSSMDFRNDTLINYHIQGDMPMTLTNACICDSLGNLLFYTNGIFVADKNGDTVLNGSGLSPCDYTNEYFCCGLNIPQGAIFLPKPGNSRYYYLFHYSNDTFEESRPGILYCSIIDREGNFNLGQVIQKNVPVLTGYILREGGITACKNANGRDYWIVLSPTNSNSFFEFLLTPDSVLGPYVQNIGPIYNGPLDIAYSKFSLDGSKYVTSCYAGLVLVMDFDRCSGQFSNPITIFNNGTNDVQNPASGAASEEFSPDARFVYVTNTVTLNQYDLSQGNPQQDSAAIHNSTDFFQMDFLQIGPNGKLYISCNNGGAYYIHAVNYPDSEGVSCDYRDTAFITSTANSANFPNMINYNLGPLVGSGCDTIPALCNSAVTNIAASICKGQTYVLGNFTHSQTGFYADTLQNINGCDSVISLQLTVDTVVAQIAQPTPDVLIATDTGNILWVSCDTTQLIEWATSDTFVPTASGEYAAIITSGMCSDTTACFMAVVNSISVVSDNLLRVLPNPADKYLYVEMGMQGSYEFQLLNGLGQIVDIRETRQVDIFDTEQLASGVYFIKAIDKNNATNSIIKKVVIAH
jgi:hypothetical protein